MGINVPILGLYHMRNNMKRKRESGINGDRRWAIASGTLFVKLQNLPFVAYKILQIRKFGKSKTRTQTRRSNSLLRTKHHWNYRTSRP